MAEVIITTALPPLVEQAIAERFECATVRLRDIGRDAFLARLTGVKAIVVAPGDPVDAMLIAGLPASVRLIASYSTGLDHVDLAAAAARDIAVTSTPDVLTDATADVAILLILMTLRGAWPAALLVAEDKWQGWSPNQVFGRDIPGKTLGIVGGGKIGAATARRAVAFGMPLAYWGRRRSDEMDALGATFFAALSDLLANADVISLHVPSTADTRGLIGRSAFAAMRPGSYLVNTARGDLIDDDAAVEALAEGRISGLGLDVFTGEPDLHPGYRNHPRVFVLPHIGSATEETRAEMGRLVLEALRAHVSGSE